MIELSWNGVCKQEFHEDVATNFTLPTKENLNKGCEAHELSMNGDPNKNKTNNPVYLTALIVDDDKNVKFMNPSNFSGNYYTPLIATGSAGNLPDRCINGGIV